MRSPLLRCFLVAALTTFGVYIVASAWGRPFEHDRAAAEAWTWAFSRLAWTPAPLALMAGCTAFVVFVVAQFAHIRPREAFIGALLPYPVILLAEAGLRGGHALLPREMLVHGPYLLVPLAAWIGAKIPLPGPVASVDGEPVSRAGNVRRIAAALRELDGSDDGVVVTRPRLDAVVQFRPAPAGSFLLDVPRAPLDDARWSRVADVLLPLGAQPAPDAEALQLEIPDAEHAAELAVHLLEVVEPAEDAFEILVDVL
jgi:hypothetical protein